MASNLLIKLKRCVSPPSLRSYFAEFISTFLFVFAAVGSAISARTLSFPFHRARALMVFDRSFARYIPLRSGRLLY
jgi:aquaporin TIP